MQAGKRTDISASRRPSSAEQDYLKAIHHLGGAEKTVSTNEIADHLDVRAPSVTGMLKRFKSAGWIKYESGAGARLTKAGTNEARRVVRRHRLLELLLVRVLGLDWSEVDAEAEALEHAVSDRIEEALAAYLGDPMEDPHGHPIPTRDGKMSQRPVQRLCDFQPGQWIIIREADDGDPNWLRHWTALGLVPGATVRLLAHEPLDDTFELLVGNSTIQTTSKGLARLRGEPTTSTAELKAA